MRLNMPLATPVTLERRTLRKGAAAMLAALKDRAAGRRPRLRSVLLGRVLSIKAVTTLTIWQMADHTSWMYYDAVAKTPRALPRRALSRPLSGGG
jgi:hypothetical protein